MSEYGQRLAKLARDNARAKHLEAVIDDMKIQRTQLREKCDRLNTVRVQESEDVANLENGGIASFLLNLTGKLEEKLDKERREAYAAQAKYDTALRELSQLEYEIDKYTVEFETLHKSGEEYRRLVRERVSSIKGGSADNDDIFALEQNLIILQEQNAELEEAVAAGETAVNTAKEILVYLDKADGWSTMDFFLGSFRVDIAKHDNLDKAQSGINQLQSQLRRFKSELADVTIDKNIGIDIDSLTTFADFFWDDLFSNLAVQEKITNAKSQINNVRYQILYTINTLNTMINENLKQQQATRDKINAG